MLSHNTSLRYLVQPLKVFPELRASEVSSETALENSQSGQLRFSRGNLPEKAPALWKVDRKPGQTCVEFIIEHYGRWIGKGLTRNYLRIDKPLYNYLAKWLTEKDENGKLKNVLPFDLPEKSEVVRREVEEGEPQDVKEARRKVWLWTARMRNAKKNRDGGSER